MYEIFPFGEIRKNLFTSVISSDLVSCELAKDVSGLHIPIPVSDSAFSVIDLIYLKEIFSILRMFQLCNTPIYYDNIFNIMRCLH